MTASSNNSGGDGLGKPAISQSVIQKSIDRIDSDLKIHVYLAGLSMSLENVIKTISMVSIIHNDRLIEKSTDLTATEVQAINDMNQILANAMSRATAKNSLKRD